MTESDDVSIEKKYQPAEYEVPTVHFQLSVDEDASSVQRIVLRDRVPESLRLQDVGIYSSGEYHGEKWEIKSTDEIRFPIQLRPGETAETLIAFQAGENELSVENVLSEPVILYEDDLEEPFEELIDGELIELDEEKVESDGAESEGDKNEKGELAEGNSTNEDQEDDDAATEGDGKDDSEGEAVEEQVEDDNFEEATTTSDSQETDTVEDGGQDESDDESPGDEEGVNAHEEDSPTDAEMNSDESGGNDNNTDGDSDTGGDDGSADGPGSSDNADDVSVGGTPPAKEESPEHVDTTATESSVAVATPDDVIEDASEAGVADGSGDVIAVEEESVTRRVVDELEDDSVSEELRHRLRSQLLSDTDPSGQVSKSLEARVEHLQSDVTELLAYRDSLKEFIDSQPEREDRLEALEDELHNLETAVDQLHGEIDTRNSEHKEEIEVLTRSVEEVQTSLAEVEQDITEVREMRNRLAEAFTTMEE